MSGYNWIDTTFFAVFALSVFLGMWRGGAREIFSILSWVAGFFVAVFFTQPLAGWFSNLRYMQSVVSSVSETGDMGSAVASQASLFSLGASFCLLFFGTLLIGSVIGYFANRVVEGGGISLFNRFIGSVVGLGKGLLIALIVIFLLQMTPVKEQESWQASRVILALQPAVQKFGVIVEPHLTTVRDRINKSLPELSNTADDVQKNGESKAPESVPTTRVFQ